MKRNIIVVWTILIIQFIFWINFYLGKIVLNANLINIIILTNIIFILSLYIILSLDKEKLETKLTNIISDQYLDAINFSKTSFVVLDDSNKVRWTSSKEISSKIQNSEIHEWLPEYQKMFKQPDTIMERQVFDKMYQIKYSKENHTITFIENEQLNYAIKELEENKVVIGYIKIDRYLDIISSRDERYAFDLSVMVRNLLVDWSDKFSILINKISNDTYKFTCHERSFKKALDDKFSFMDVIRNESDKKLKTIATFSMGIGRDADSMIKLEAIALEALETCEKRGGDQAAIHSLGKETIFIGGNVEAQTSKSKTKIRTFAQNLLKILKERGPVIIVGHKYPDHDSISGSLAIAKVAKVYRKNVKVVIDFQNIDMTFKNHLEKLLGPIYISKNIISPKEARKIITKNTLGIIIDTTSAGRLELPEITQCKKIIAIDHHRIGRDMVENITLEHIDPCASSTAEIIIETITFIKSKEINLSVEELNLLFAGIIVDTNNFKSRTGARTFQAVAKLRSWGADQDVVHRLLAEPRKTLEIKYEAIKNAKEFKPNIFISVFDEETILSSSIAAQAAEGLMEIIGAKASFIIGLDDKNNCIVSARSDGKSINVQKIMEALGGGGHFNAAATKTQLTKSVILKKLKEVLREKL